MPVICEKGKCREGSWENDENLFKIFVEFKLEDKKWMNEWWHNKKSNFAKWWWNKKAVLCSFEKKVKEEYHSILQRGKSAGQKQILLLRNLEETVYTGADIVNKL